jgi:diguanylate cyclase (GGDEF)-like protein/PAS domain S-box-containing protein
MAMAPRVRSVAAKGAGLLANSALDEVALPADDARELSRLALAMIVAIVAFAILSIGLVVATGDAAAMVGVAVLLALAAWMIQARRQLKRRPRRGALLLVIGMLAFVLFLAPIPPPTPGLAAAPILAVAYALSFLSGRRLTAALIGAVSVALAAAIIIEVTPNSPDMPEVIAAALRVGTVTTIVGLVGFVLYRHRRRLEHAVARAEDTSDALRDSEERYRPVVEGIREVIFRVDGTGRATLLNEAWHELTGYEVADSIGRPIMDFVHPDEREVSADLSRPVVLGEVKEYRHELRVVGSDGADIWVEAHARPLHDEAGNFRGMSGTLTNITARHELEQRLLTQAFHDDLTGLANRALFRDRVEHALDRRLSERHLVGLLFLDLDRFKTVNDSLGHTAGDRLLVAIAARLRAAIRPEDTIARFGGDEFAVLLEDASSPHDVLAMAERISATFDLPFRVDEGDITVRSSIGVVIAAAGHRTADDLLRDADVAMYRAKVTGRGSYALFEPSMQAAVAGRLQLEADLREAIEHERLTLAYQPIVDLRDGRIVAVEALARWTHPERGEVPPSVFIPSAEESGLIVPLGAWILRRACLDLATLRQSGGTARAIRLNVNLSPRQLRDSSIVGEVLGALRGAGLKPDVLDLEITESLVLDCGPDGIEWLRILRSAGCGVAFDDFGTGFSSLGNLRTLPIDGLKIDISFVSAMLDGGVDAALVEAIIGLGAALRMTVVAEGVEDAPTAARLAELGCPLAQGFHFGRPEPVAVLAARLAELAKVVPAA